MKLSTSYVEAHYTSHGQTLVQEFSRVSRFSRICSLKGIISVMQSDMLMHPISKSDPFMPLSLLRLFLSLRISVESHLACPVR